MSRLRRGFLFVPVPPLPLSGFSPLAERHQFLIVVLGNEAGGLEQPPVVQLKKKVEKRVRQPSLFGAFLKLLPQGDRALAGECDSSRRRRSVLLHDLKMFPTFLGNVEGSVFQDPVLGRAPCFLAVRVTLCERGFLAAVNLTSQMVIW